MLKYDEMFKKRLLKRFSDVPCDHWFRNAGEHEIQFDLLTFAHVLLLQRADDLWRRLFLWCGEGRTVKLLTPIALCLPVYITENQELL